MTVHTDGDVNRHARLGRARFLIPVTDCGGLPRSVRSADVADVKRELRTDEQAVRVRLRGCLRPGVQTVCSMPASMDVSVGFR